MAHARGGLEPFSRREAARWLWLRLARRFPEALAAVLMPDHLHLIGPPGAERALAALLASFSRWLGRGELWRKVPPGEEITTLDKLARGLRYLALNPTRPTRGHARLVTDPLAWEWSTHRDVVGAVADPWVTEDRLCEALGWHPGDFRARFHRYVSSDPHVAVEGTPLPRCAPSSELPLGSIDAVKEAALLAARADEAALRSRTPARRLFLRLAYRQGWRFPGKLALLCDVHPNTIPRVVHTTPDARLHAAALCLGDERLARLRT